MERSWTFSTGAESHLFAHYKSKTTVLGVGALYSVDRLLNLKQFVHACLTT